MDVRDSNGTILKEGDSVQIIKDLKVKGSSTVLKRGTLIKGIHLTDNGVRRPVAPFISPLVGEKAISTS